MLLNIKTVNIEFEYDILENNAIVYPSIHIIDNMGTCILATFNGPSATTFIDKYFGIPLKKGRYKSVCKIPANFLNDNNYLINAYLVTQDVADMGIAEEVLSFIVEETGEMRNEFTGDWIGLIRPKLEWVTAPLLV